MFTMLAAAFLLAACQEEQKLPAVSFETAIPTTVDGASVLSIMVKDYTGTDAVTFPVTFSGTAEKDVDYTASAEAFIFGGASPVTTIKVTPINYDAQKTVTASINLPAGFQAGTYQTTTFSLSEKIGYCSFVGKTAIMTTTAKIPVGIYDGNGNPLKLQDGDEIPVSVNTAKSTAKEGVNFNFADGVKAAVISPASSQGYITLEFAGTVDTDADLIVLNLNPSNKYGAGNNLEIEVSIIGSQWEKLGGTWKINELVTTKEGIIAEWYCDESSLEGYPVFNSEDSFTIDTETGTLVPDFKSEFKNYFIGESGFSVGEELPDLKLYNNLKALNLQMFNLDNVNRDFSAATQSDDRTAIAGIRMITDDSGNELLDLYIIDYQSTAFMVEEWNDPSWSMYNDDKPKATMSGMYINATFKKAE